MAGRHHHSNPQGKTLLLPPVKLFHLQFQKAAGLLLKQHKMSGKSYAGLLAHTVEKTCLLNVINGRIYCQTTLATGWCKTFLMLKTFSFKVFYFYSVLQWTPVIKLEPL